VEREGFNPDCPALSHCEAPQGELNMHTVHGPVVSGVCSHRQSLRSWTSVRHVGSEGGAGIAILGARSTSSWLSRNEGRRGPGVH
jgi:hypothetical protein